MKPAATATGEGLSPSPLAPTVCLSIGMTKVCEERMKLAETQVSQGDEAMASGNVQRA